MVVNTAVLFQIRYIINALFAYVLDLESLVKIKLKFRYLFDQF